MTIVSKEDIKKLNEIKDHIMKTSDIYSLKKEELNYPPEYEQMVDNFIKLKELKEELFFLVQEYNRTLNYLPSFIKENHLFLGVENENNS